MSGVCLVIVCYMHCLSTYSTVKENFPKGTIKSKVETVICKRAFPNTQRVKTGVDKDKAIIVLVPISQDHNLQYFVIVKQKLVIVLDLVKVNFPIGLFQVSFFQGYLVITRKQLYIEIMRSPDHKKQLYIMSRLKDTLLYTLYIPPNEQSR